ncbi:unnamed protein product [Echinostoma caproni]|uniref:Cytochrome c oxidase subunit 4 n=1 Tax=Echinostoma caproni TaxID=27848 RepID=A0A183BGV9_9TREM|nr:unnamed protein product [Echinostoma caproni]
MLSVRAIQSRVGSLPIIISRSTTTVLSPLEQKYFPQIGNREIVGFGRNGVPIYYDDKGWPYPAIRFRNHDEKIEALHKKEEGPWGNLTIDEVKTLYRHSFCRTLEEAHAPHGIWKLGLAWGLMLMTVGCVVYIYVQTVRKWSFHWSHRFFIIQIISVLEYRHNVMELPEYKEAMVYKKVLGRIGGFHELNAFDVQTHRFKE